MAENDHHLRHSIAWKCLRPLTEAIMLGKFNFHTESISLEKPSFIVCNHNSDWDPGFIVCAFKDQVYFVASEHLLRLGFVSTFVKWLQDPIARQKGGNAASTVMNVMRRLKKGYNVCLFPEGNRSWDGVTRAFLPSTGKLAKVCGAQLITYRTSGAYFANPRWAGPSVRKGIVNGRIVGIYSPEKLQSLSPSEINDIISRDLFEDAYECQRLNPIPYKGKRLAEHLETLLFICPHCGELHVMVSNDNRFFCTACGYEVKYMQTGFFEGQKPVFDNVRDWSQWQDRKISELCDNHKSGPIFTDSCMELSEVTTGRSSKRIGIGDISLYSDRLELPGDTVLPLTSITGMALRGASDLFIGADGRNYQVHTEKVRCTVKYLTACTHLGCPVGYGV